MSTMILPVAFTVSIIFVSTTGSARDYPRDDFRRCLEVSKKNNVQRLEVLPGFGWDNLRNMDQGQVINYNFSQCRTIDDGRFLLPDSVTTVPIKTSSVTMFPELIEHWSNWTSITSKSINAHAGLSFGNISGKFSADFEDMRAKQIGDESVITRAQLRYVRYAVQMQPDSPLHPAFKARLLKIAAAHKLNDKEQARYMSQLVVRDFGTHVISRAHAGAALIQVDNLREEWVNSQSKHKSDILAAATTAFLLSIFHMGASYETNSDEKFMQTYVSQRTSFVVITLGGPLFKPANFTIDMWANDVDKDLVALDRSGDPLYNVITASALPELPAPTLAQVWMSVKEAIELYYEVNVLRGCLDPRAPNFSPAANVDDGSCKDAPSNYTFGGMYQTCDVVSDDVGGDPCSNLTQVNPLTGGYSCPANYRAVSIHSDTQHITSCHRCWLFFTCCDTEAHYEIFWCAATGPVPQHTGYMFGGLYTSQISNLVTRTKTCPLTFQALNVGSGRDLHVCISDDYELGTKYAVPFAGFISCDTGNPLAVGQVQSKPRSHVYQDGGMSLQSFFSGAATSWPQKCPDGFSKHLATVDRGCQINYCVQTGALSDPALPHVKRPPYMASPVQKGQGPDSVADGSHSSDGSAPYSMLLGLAAVIFVFLILAFIVMAKKGVLAVRWSGYRRLGNPLMGQANECGVVEATSVGTGDDAAILIKL